MKDYIEKVIQQTPNQMISYDEYIRLALYHEEKGYYMRNQLKVGRQGDFLTTSNIGDVYGELMARWLVEKVKIGLVEARFCEIGAGGGRFAKSFLHAWSNLTNSPLDYYICEISPYHRSLHQDMLAGQSFTHIESVEDLADFKGVIFSNELFDALPVRVITCQNQQLFEVMITQKQGSLVETLIPLTDKNVLTFLQEHNIRLVHDQRYEVPLAMTNMLETIASTLVSGYVVTVDYGYTNEEWQQPNHQRGSLRGYLQHQMVQDVLTNPGMMDITSHIHWDVLMRVGERLELHTERFLRQDEFFIDMGILEQLVNHYDSNPFSEISKKNRAIRTLITPGGISSHFQVLVQMKK